MAAAEYFSSAPMAGQQQQSPYQAPNARPQQLVVDPMGNNYHSDNQSIPQIYSHPPPPYQAYNQENRPGVHFGPSPINIQQRPNISPYQNSSHNSYYSSQQIPQVQQQSQNQLQHYGNSPLGNSPYGTSPGQQYLTPHTRPYNNPNSAQYRPEVGYSSDPEPDRRRHKHHHRGDDHSRHDRGLSTSKRSRSSNADAFLGAAGGGLVGDLIFPGLGTLGGAALGWLGGREYGKGRKGREEKLRDAQYDWEEKFRPGMHEHHEHYDHGLQYHRDQGRRVSSGDSSQTGERERKSSHDSRYR